MAELDEIRVAIRAELSQFTSGLKQAEQQVKSSTSAMDASFSKLGATMGAVFGGYTLARFIQQSVAAYAEAEKAGIKLDSVLMSMGRSSEKLSGQLRELAQQIQGEGIIDDESILRGQAFLATFNTISDNVLPRATRAMADLAAMMGGDTRSAAMLLGRASAGMTEMLARYGIVLSEDVKKSGDFSKVLEEIEKKIGGMNKALGDSATGQLTQFKNMLNDIMEQVGGPLTFAIAEFAKDSSDNIKWWGDSVVEVFGFVIDTLDLIARLFKTVGQTIGAATAQAAAFAKLEFSEAAAIGKDWQDQLNAIWDPAKVTDRYTAYQEKLKSLASQGKGGKGISDEEAKAFARRAEFLKEEEELVKSNAAVWLKAQEERIRLDEEEELRLEDLAEQLRLLYEPFYANMKVMKDFDLLLEKGLITWEIWAEAAAKAHFDAADAAAQANEQMTDLMKNLLKATEGWGRDFTNTLVDAVMTGKASFSDLANAIIGDLLRIMTQALITDQIISMLGITKDAQGATTIAGGLLGAIMGRASGGQVHSSSAYLVGERGPELFTPDTAGVIHPSSLSSGQPSGGGITVNNTFQISTGVSQTVRAELQQQMPKITEQIRNSVADSRMRGGRFSAAFAQ